MADKTVTLDEHRGMAAQKATEVRRLLAAVAADEQAFRKRQAQLEEQLLAAPATTWADAADKVRYLLGLFAASTAGRDPRRRQLIANVLDDLERLGASEASNDNPHSVVADE